MISQLLPWLGLQIIPVRLRVFVVLHRQRNDLIQIFFRDFWFDPWRMPCAFFSFYCPCRPYQHYSRRRNSCHKDRPLLNWFGKKIYTLTIIIMIIIITFRFNVGSRNYYEFDLCSFRFYFRVQLQAEMYSMSEVKPYLSHDNNSWNVPTPFIHSLYVDTALYANSQRI